MGRSVAALLLVNAVLSLSALGWLTWITLEPQHWFSDAYAEKGPRGDPGPRGREGPVGPAGPVGPDAAEAVAELESRVTELEGYVAENDIPALESRVSDLETTMGDVESTVSSMCDQFLYSGTLEDISYAAC